MNNNGWMDWLDDKTQVIIAVFILGMTMILLDLSVASQHMDAVLSGLLGVAVGKIIK